MLAFVGSLRHSIAYVLAALVAFTGPVVLSVRYAMAHTEEQMAAMVGDHGGQVRAAGNHHLELTAGNGVIRIWVTDHGNTAEATDKSTGSATIFTGEKRFVVPLTPAALNELRGSNPGIGSGEMRVILNVSMPGEEPLQARYQLGKHVH